MAEKAKKVTKTKKTVRENGKLTEKQRRFIDFYIETGNASEACRQAGYKAKDYNSLGSQNYAKLRNHINIKLKEKEDARIASHNEVLFYLSAVLRGSEKEECVVTESMGEGCGSSARIIKKQVTPSSRLEAAKQLAKIYGIASKIEKEKADLEKQKFEFTKQQQTQSTTETESDGFLEALNASAKEVWLDENDPEVSEESGI